MPNIFLGCLKFLMFLDAGSEPTYAEKIESPPPPWDKNASFGPLWAQSKMSISIQPTDNESHVLQPLCNLKEEKWL